MISGERTLLPRQFRDIDELVEQCWQLVGRELGEKYGPKEIKIRMALTEAIINAWKHGNRRRPDLPIVFRWRCAKNFTFEVIDAGAGFNFLDLPDPTRDEQLSLEAGRGIFIIKTFARSVSWRNQGRHLIATFLPQP